MNRRVNNRLFLCCLDRKKRAAGLPCLSVHDHVALKTSLPTQTGMFNCLFWGLKLYFRGLGSCLPRSGMIIAIKLEFSSMLPVSAQCIWSMVQHVRTQETSNPAIGCLTCCISVRAGCLRVCSRGRPLGLFARDRSATFLFRRPLRSAAAREVGVKKNIHS